MGQLPWDVLDRYFDSSASRDDAQAVAEWVASDPQHGLELERLRRVWQAGAGARRYDVNAAWQATQQRVQRAADDRKVDRTPRFRLALAAKPDDARRRYVGLTAAAVVLIFAGVVWQRDRLAGDDGSGSGGAMREYATTRAQRAEVLLADGSRVLLNAQSRLRVPEAYGATSRDVFLEGEAYFDVRHDARRPFRVHAAQAVAEDLGTTFVVRAYATDTEPLVVVQSGLVELHAKDTSVPTRVTLKPGHLGRVDAAGRMHVEVDVDVARYLAWTRGQLEWKKVPLAEAARELERWYDIEIVISDSALAKAVLSASFADEPLAEVLDIVASSLGISYRRDGRTVHFIP